MLYSIINSILLRLYLAHVKKPVIISFTDKSMGYKTGLSAWLIFRPCNDIWICAEFLEDKKCLSEKWCTFPTS